MNETLKKTPLHALHVALGAKMTAFAGYDMPVHYTLGVLKEHQHTREKAGLFDVSHMGQASIVAEDHEAAARAIELITPGEIKKLASGRQRYTVLLNDDGGVVDDLMVSRPGSDGEISLVVNAACKEGDYDFIESRLPGGVELRRHEDRALLALQGPKSSAALGKLAPGAADLKFMSVANLEIDGVRAIVSRSGYTGEDGYEISVAADNADTVARLLLDDQNVEPIGLGARDSLRLEAGLCLYGHDITQETTPVEAAISFAIGKRRREEGGFPGAERILSQLQEGAPHLRVGVKPEGRAPAREGALITDLAGKEIGRITSGGFGPTIQGPIAMGYVEKAHSAVGANLLLSVRGKS
ncbi:MAG: glycine cleavage system aminomethyltransferase GcvT, partial [Pseudomonadota bacterium]